MVYFSTVSLFVLFYCNYGAFHFGYIYVNSVIVQIRYMVIVKIVVV